MLGIENLTRRNATNMERITYALIGAVFGALIGVVCWWLYGLGSSLRFTGLGIDPALRHWLFWSATAFGVVGFVFRARVGSFAGDILSAVFQLESNYSSGGSISVVFGLVLVAIIVAAIWFSVPAQ